MAKKQLLTLAFGLAAIAYTFAQAPDPNAKIPLDPEVRYGVLDNGDELLPQHIDKKQLEGKANFHLVVNVGAVEETPAQAGLAHLLEHMAFETKDFPEKGDMINFFRSVGIDFSAYTTMEVTNYFMKNVSLERESLVDSAFMVLRNWASEVRLATKAIDVERGTISEEIRMREKELNDYAAVSGFLLKGSRYEGNNLIGSEKGVKSFKTKELRDFYEKWYRPDMQAVIVVGDIDVDQMEQRVRSELGVIKKPNSDCPKEFYDILDNQEPHVGIFQIADRKGTILTVNVKREPLSNEENATFGGERQLLIRDMIVKMIDKRFDDMNSSSSDKSIKFYVSDSRPALTANVLTFSASTPPAKVKETYEALATEIARLQRFGFSNKEVMKMQKQIMRAVSSRVFSKPEKKPDPLVEKYRTHFRLNRPFMSKDTDWLLSTWVARTITRDEVNECLKTLLTDENQVITVVTGDDHKIAMPTEAEILGICKDVQGKKLSKFANRSQDGGGLISKEPAGGHVKSVEDGMFESKVITLDNGVTVVAKKTSHDKNKVSLSAIADGGLSLLDDGDFYTGKWLSDFTGYFKNISRADVNTKTAGSNAYVALKALDYEATISGSSTTGSLKTMMQLLHLNLTQTHFDYDRFRNKLSSLNSSLEPRDKDPYYIMSDNVGAIQYGDHFRRMPPRHYLDKVDYDRLRPVFDKMFGNASDFVFVIVGDFDMKELETLVDKYLGSLKTDPAARSKMVDRGDHRVAKSETRRIKAPMHTPKTSMTTMFVGPFEYSQSNAVAMNFLSRILGMKYFDYIRGEKGATYSVSAYATATARPVDEYVVTVDFDTDPNRAAEMSPLVFEAMKRMAAQGPSSEDMQKARTSIKRNFDASLKNNATWSSFLMQYYLYGRDGYTGLGEAIDNMEAGQVKDLMDKIVADGTVVQVIMDAADKE